MLDLGKLRDSLIKKNYDQRKVSKFIAYLSSESTKKDNNIVKHTVLELMNLFAKYYNAGTNLDGVNVVLTGKNMGLITYHGYMNKVKQNHDGVFFDVQLIRGDDKFSFSKKSGSVVYEHKIANPFADDEIKGAYCVVKFPDGNQSLELLNQRDYEEMKNSSRSKFTWEKWPSEFWRKSVIKRACKVYFAEEVESLEAIDNKDYGLEIENEDASDETKNEILEAHRGKNNQNQNTQTKE